MWDWDTIRRIIEVLFIINDALAIWTVFRSRRDIASTWAWLLVLILFPYVGFIAYLFLGRQLSHDDIFSMRKEARRVGEKFLLRQLRLLREHHLLPSADHHQQERMLAATLLDNGHFPLTFDNHVELYTDGHVKFDHLIDDINHAQHSVNIEYYTFYADKLGYRVLKELEDAAARGVAVRVLYDASGSRGTRPQFFNHLRKLGGQAQPFVSAPAH